MTLLERLEKIEVHLQPVFRVVMPFLVGAWLTIILLYRKSLTSWGGIIVLWGVLLAVAASAKPMTTRRLLQMLRGASREKGFVLRLTGFIVVAVGTSLILSTKTATFLEEVFAITIMTYAWFCNVLQVSENL